MIDLKSSENENLCLMANKRNSSWLWHKRLRHASLSILNKLVKLDLVIGLPNKNFQFDGVCEACAKGKHTRNTFKLKKFVTTTKSFELVHMDLFGPTKSLSLNEKWFGLVIVDDYSKFTWLFFLLHKNHTFE